jgi:hypothetical protein
VLRQIKIVYEVQGANPRDPYWTGLGKGFRCFQYTLLECSAAACSKYDFWDHGTSTTVLRYLFEHANRMLKGGLHKASNGQLRAKESLFQAFLLAGTCSELAPRARPLNIGRWLRHAARCRHPSAFRVRGRQLGRRCLARRQLLGCRRRCRPIVALAAPSPSPRPPPPDRPSLTCLAKGGSRQVSDLIAIASKMAVPTDFSPLVIERKTRVGPFADRALEHGNHHTRTTVSTDGSKYVS